MININTLAKDLENGLNQAIAVMNEQFVNESYQFTTMSEAGRYKKAQRTDNHVTHFISSVLSITNASSTTTNNGVIMGVYYCSFQFAVPLQLPRYTKNPEGEVIPLEETEENKFLMPIYVRSVVDNYFKANKEVIIQSEDGQPYTAGVEYSIPATGISGVDSMIGEYLLMTAYITYSYVEGGVNTKSWVFLLDGEAIPYQDFTITRQSISEPNVFAGEDVAKNVSASTQVKFEFLAPVLQNNPLASACYEYILAGKKNVAHELTVKIEGQSIENTYKVIFEAANVSGQYVKNSGFNFTLVQSVDDANALAAPASAWIISFNFSEAKRLVILLQDEAGQNIQTEFSYSFSNGQAGESQTMVFMDYPIGETVMTIIPKQKAAAIRLYSGSLPYESITIIQEGK